MSSVTAALAFLGLKTALIRFTAVKLKGVFDKTLNFIQTKFSKFEFNKTSEILTNI